MSSSRFPLLLALCVALFAGFVPLRECLAAESGEQGVVAVGTHTHGHAEDHADDHADDSADDDASIEARARVGGRSDGCGADHDAGACCVDAPFSAGVRVDLATARVCADRASVATLASMPATIFLLSLPAAFLDEGGAERAPPPAPPSVRAPVPSGVYTVVLLR